VKRAALLSFLFHRPAPLQHRFASMQAMKEIVPAPPPIIRNDVAAAEALF
jgi:hypothetical protein